MAVHMATQNGRLPRFTAHCSLPRTRRLIIQDAVLGAFFGRQVTSEQVTDSVDGVVVIGIPIAPLGFAAGLAVIAWRERPFRWHYFMN